MNSTKHVRKVIRMQDYDYSQAGLYFVTICAKNRNCLFGEIVNDSMQLNIWGKQIDDCWLDIPLHEDNVILDVYVIMPNHIHGIVQIQSHSKVDEKRKPRTLGLIIGSFKASVSRKINAQSQIDKVTIWQSGFYDHVIRNESSLIKIRNYIETNPIRWNLDSENPVKDKQYN